MSPPKDCSSCRNELLDITVLELLPELEVTELLEADGVA